MTYSWRTLGIIFLLIFLLTLSTPALSQALTPDYFHLEGIHKFNPGDNPVWSSTEYDDSHWKETKTFASRQSQVLKIKNGLGWHRIHFKGNKRWKDIQPALFLGRPGDADEVFLNGIRIGGEGIISSRFVDASKVERLYVIPAGLLRFDEGNLLAVRVMNPDLKWGLSSASIRLGNYNELLMRKMNLEGVTKRVETAFFAFFALYTVYCAFLYLKGIRGREYISFGLSFLIYGIYYLLDSLTFYETGLKTYAVQKTIMALPFLFPPLLLYSLTGVFNERLTALIKFIISLFTALFLVIILFLTLERYPAFLSLGLFAALFSGFAALSLAAGAYRRKEYESGSVLAGVILLSAGGAGLILDAAGIVTLDIYGHSFSVYIVSLWMICMMYSLVERYARIQENVKVLSGRILSAQEEERKRLAEELHDSLGQNMLAMKLNLQRINKEVENKAISHVIEELSESIVDLRHILKGLMPVPLREMGIDNAMKAYGKKFSEKTGIETAVSSGLDFRPAPDIELNLFRLFQEALNNASKHSCASAIDVCLKSKGTMLVMDITDNGGGFDYRKELSDRHGMGLSVMEERVRDMKGKLTVKTGEGKGTAIRVEVPVR